MSTRLDEKLENDPTPSRVVAERYREVIFEDDDDRSLALVHYRGGPEEFALGEEYCASPDPAARATGATILAQLGWQDQTYLEESVKILIPLLEDPDERVVNHAAVALGHRGDELAIPALIKHSDHPSALARYGVVYGLSGHEDERAIAALIKLAADEDRDVRDWAVFGLGSQMEADSPEIREALRRALLDPDQEIRGEGLVGLAKRGDSGIVAALLDEWRDDHFSLLSLEAAAEVKDSRLHERLNELAAMLGADDDPWLVEALEKAIAACTPAA